MATKVAYVRWFMSQVGEFVSSVKLRINCWIWSDAWNTSRKASRSRVTVFPQRCCWGWTSSKVLWTQSRF